VGRLMMVIADDPRHFPSAVFQQPDVEKLRQAVAILWLAAVVDIKVVLSREYSPVRCAILLQREELDRFRDCLPAQAEVRLPTQTCFEGFGQGAKPDRGAALVVI